MNKDQLENLNKFHILGAAPSYTNCVICNNPFTKEHPSSIEHIIPESIGGVVTADNLYCKNCNSAFGYGIDKELFENFQYEATVLNTKRPSNNPLPNMRIKTHTEKEFTLKPGGRIELHSLIYKETKDGKENLVVRADTEEELLKKKKEISESLAKKGKTFNVSEIKKLDTTFVYEEELNNFRLNFTTGKENALTSILKIAFTFALSQNVPLEFMNHLPPILKGEKRKFGIVVPYIYPSLTTPPLIRERVNHSILLFGLPDEKILFAIVELFSTFRYFTFLSSRYEGIAAKAFISQSCTTGEITNEPEIKLELEKYIQPQSLTHEALIEAFRKEISPLKELIDRISYSHLIGKTMDFDFGPFKKGQLVSENDIEDFLRDMPKLNASIEYLQQKDSIK